MAKRENSDGYYIAKLNLNNHLKSIAIHRLVAQAFIPNPNNYKEVNHIDCNRKNNVFTNLEWCTHKQNVQHSANLNHYRTPKGKLNYNYGNKKLHNRYLLEPELSKLQSRPHEQNGSAKPISMYDTEGNFIRSFLWIGECANYLISIGASKSKINSIRTSITKSIKESSPYCNYIFNFI